MASVQDLVKQILLAAHPIGSYYWSSEATDPGTLFGGTWERVKGRFVYASDADTAGETGGSATHTMTVGEMPAHTHPVSAGFLWKWGVPTASESVQASTVSGYTTAVGNALCTNRELPGSAGGGAAFSVMPPFVTAFCWRRTA